jgi:hypothetical protein
LGKSCAVVAAGAIAKATAARNRCLVGERKLSLLEKFLKTDKKATLSFYLRP